MKTTKVLSYSIFIVLSMIFLINIVNAQTLIAGKVYTSGYSNIVSGADVAVTCNSHILNTNTLNDGTYAVRFEENLCKINDNVEVNAAKGTLSGSGSGTIIECDGSNDCDSGLFSIINLAIKTKSTSGSHVGSGGSFYYNCGNGRCDSGETINTCAKDCSIFINQNVTSAPANNETNNGDNNQTQTLTTLGGNNQSTNSGGLSRITGAVVGTLGTGWIVIIVFIVGILGLSLAVRFIRKKKNIEFNKQ